jgi:hypothetical protein
LVITKENVKAIEQIIRTFERADRIHEGIGYKIVKITDVMVDEIIEALKKASHALVEVEKNLKNVVS